MNTTYANEVANVGRTIVTYIGLVDAAGNELTSGNYARQPVSWTAPSNGQIRPTANLVFQVSAGDVVAGWRGYSSDLAGVDYGGSAVTQRTYANPGTYTLNAAETAINHTPS